MAFIPAPDVAQVEIRCTYLGQRVENTLYFQYGSVLTIPAMTTLGNAVEDWFNTNMLPTLSSGVTYNETYVTNLSSVTSPTVTVNDEAGSPGGDASPSQPGNVTWCVSFRTVQRGRSARGRNYIFGLTEAATSGNFIDSATADTWVGYYEDMLSPTFAADFTWSVLSRYTNGAPRLLGVTIPITQVLATDYALDSQRRRLSGRGS